MTAVSGGGNYGFVTTEVFNPGAGKAASSKMAHPRPTADPAESAVSRCPDLVLQCLQAAHAFKLIANSHARPN